MVHVVDKTEDRQREKERVSFLESAARRAFPNKQVANFGDIIVIGEDAERQVVTIYPYKALITVIREDYFKGTKKLADEYEEKFGLAKELIIETDYS